MPRSISAIITNKVLVWAREELALPTAVVAKRVGTTDAKLAAWESGASLPTLRQARKLAAVYRQPLAAFYLPSPPEPRLRVPRDYRRLAGTTLQISTAIRLAVIEAREKREVALELLALQGTSLPQFSLWASLDENTENVGTRLRTALGVNKAEQSSWRSSRVAFNEWRSRAEGLGVLVLQTSEAEIEELRAFSLYDQPLPVVALNRKDVTAARSFSLLHECVHLMLHAEGVCDLSTDARQNPEIHAIEVFCNAAAAACLMPASSVREHPVAWHHSAEDDWTDKEIEQLAASFSVSREALLRRLLTLSLTTSAFYERKRKEYQAEYQSREKTKGYPSPAVDAVSSLGKPYVRLVLSGLEAGQITSSDASDYLGVRLKHFPALANAVSSE